MTRTYMGRRLWVPALVALLVLALDQITKALVLRTWPLPQTGEFPIIPRWLAFTYIRNDGVAFGLFQGMPQFFTVTSLVIVTGAIYYYLRHIDEHDRWARVILGLIVGGALGNVIDRIRYGYVVDFIKTLDGRFPVFNLADSAVVIGVFLMALHMFLDDTSPKSRVVAEADDHH
jgi:signal peptidase II